MAGIMDTNAQTRNGAPTIIRAGLQIDGNIKTSSDIFGYQLHDNIVANQMHNFKLPDSYLFSYNFDGITHECPYKTEEEMFDVDEIISSIKRQGL